MRVIPPGSPLPATLFRCTPDCRSRIDARPCIPVRRRGCRPLPSRPATISPSGRWTGSHDREEPAMAKPGKHRIARAVLELHPRTQAEELGIDVGRNTPAPLYQWLIVSLLYKIGRAHV